MMKKVNYLNNKDILAEIHKSKNTFCSFTDPLYSEYDIILTDIEKINIRTIAEAKKIRAKKLSMLKYEEEKSLGNKIKISDCEIDYKKIEKHSLIFRIMTYNHIPDEPGRKKTPKTIADGKIKLNFPPFQHWKFNEKDELICVGKSHWVGVWKMDIFQKTMEKSQIVWLLCG